MSPVTKNICRRILQRKSELFTQIEFKLVYGPGAMANVTDFMTICSRNDTHVFILFKL